MLPDGQLEALLAPARERQASLRAQLWGSGAIAQGTGAQAVGERGIGARDFQGVAVTGDHNMVILASEAAAAFWRQFAGPHAAASQDVGPHSVSLQVSKAELERATARYLELLLDRYRYLDFRGMGVSDRVPLRLPLVQFIAAYCCHRGMDLPVQAMLQEALAQGGALLLLDGLDEVRDLSRRHLVVERVVDCFVAHRAQGNKFVLTSRAVGYREVRPVCEGLIECTLVDFGQDEIEAFVDKWTAALERAARGDTPLAIVEAERERRELLEAVQRNPGVRDLAANPLLLTVLALMKRQGVTLPERRVQLYDQYVQTLLSSWNRARGLGRPPARDLDVVETMRSLAPLALWMHQVSPGVGLVRQGDLQRQLQEVYSTRGEADPERAARRFLEDVRGYAGLLLERGAGQYGFIHLTFEEYLAAVGIARLGQREIAPIVQTLSEHVGDPAWREVALLTIGYLGIVQQWEEVASDVVTALLDRRPGEPGQAAVWVGDAVVDAWPGGVTPGCKEGVIQALIQVMAADERVQPAQRALAGDTLARLGDPRPDVGLRADGLPDIAWCEVPGGPFWMDDRGQRTLPTFWIGKYPITNAQYAAFGEDEGYTDRWRSCWTDAGWSWKRDRAGPET